MSISQVEKGKRFRALHDGPWTFVIPNPSNASYINPYPASRKFERNT